MPANAIPLFISRPALSERGSTAYAPRCSSSRARQTRPIVFPSWRVARSRADRPPRTRPRWRPCARVSASTIVDASPCLRTPMISPSSRHSIASRLRLRSAKMRRRGHAGELQGDEKRERGERADECGLSRPRAEGEDPAADRAREARARVIEEEVKRACLRLPRVGPQADPAPTDRVAAKKSDRDDADPDDREPQAIGQSEDDADRHEHDGEADDSPPAITSGKFAHHPPGDA